MINNIKDVRKVCSNGVLMPQSFTEVIGALLEVVTQVEQPSKLLDAIHQVVLLNEAHRDSEATIVAIESVNHELAEQLDVERGLHRESVEQYDVMVSQLRREKAELSTDELLPDLLIEIMLKIKEQRHFSEEDRMVIGQCIGEVFREVLNEHQ